MKAWEHFGAGDIESAMLPKDMQSRGLIHLSVIRGHLEVTTRLIASRPADIVVSLLHSVHALVRVSGSFYYSTNDI